jgi:formylmethanofuran dehydrogenase subunit A
MPALSLTKIAGGVVYDPIHGVHGEVRDIWISDGKIVDTPGDPQQLPDTLINASGLVVMPAGVDMHSHIAGPKVNTARKMRPEDRRHGALPRSPLCRSGTMGSVPSTFATGYKYAALGYTTVFDAAVPPLAARHAHEELNDTPCIDAGFFALLGNNHYVMQAIRDAEPDRLRAFVGWLLSATKSYAAKLVNPGGVELFKQRARGNVSGIDSEVTPFGVTPRQIIASVARAADELRLPHSVHIHCNQLGIPGNWQTTLASMQALDGHRGHFTHIQFHSYGGGESDENAFHSKVPQLAEYVNAHPNVTVDVGQVLFGDTTSMTGDGPVGQYLADLYGTKWFSADTEQECGCGIAPIRYKPTTLVHAVQWAIGLEWFLLVDDPWRIVLSTDHPNGASFLAYPEIVQLLMDRTYREEVLQRVHPKVRERSVLAELDREYSLSEICIITRAAPARILGLTQKGHLGPGADADVMIYRQHENPKTMFELPKYVIKNGQVVVVDGEIRRVDPGCRFHAEPDYDRDYEGHIADWFERYYSIRFANYPVGKEYLSARLHQ